MVRSRNIAEKIHGHYARQITTSSQFLPLVLEVGEEPPLWETIDTTQESPPYDHRSSTFESEPDGPSLYKNDCDFEAQKLPIRSRSVKNCFSFASCSITPSMEKSTKIPTTSEIEVTRIEDSSRQPLDSSSKSTTEAPNRGVFLFHTLNQGISIPSLNPPSVSLSRPCSLPRCQAIFWNKFSSNNSSNFVDHKPLFKCLSFVGSGGNKGIRERWRKGHKGEERE
uniref:Uncharacterized protein n=1 Tax=Nelumbo nucifera TaxID=4432 RepID=A0A822ZXE2_NELNU|nr:TPA_asm: hypothetical protein HUJ06_016505 [Nelumbo nucifera]